MAGIIKSIMLKQVKEAIENKEVFVTSFDQLTVSKISELRNALRKNDAQGLVTKSTLAKKALDELGMDGASDVLDRTVFLVAAERDPQIISKELVDFAKGNDSFEVRGLFSEGAFRAADYVKALATLPSRDQLLASVVGGIKAPITNFVLGMGGFLRNLVVVLNEVKKKKSE